MAASPTYPSGIGKIAKTLVNADSTNWVDLYDNSAGSSSARVEALNICSDDTATVVVQLGWLISGTVFLLGAVSIPTLSGTNGSAARANALTTLGVTAPDSIAVLEIPAGAKLQAKAVSAVTSAKTVTLSGWARLYA